MNRHQINELNMYDAVEQLLLANAIIWNPNPAMTAAIQTFVSHLSAINANDTVQKTSSKGTTISKNTSKADMALAAISVANAGKAYASATGNAVLFDQMNKKKSDIMLAADTDADDICQNIHDDLQPYIANTTAYGATTASLTNLQSLIGAYSAMIGKPALQKSIVANATISLVQHFAAINALLKNQLDPLMAQYQNSNAVFYNQYQSVRVINDIGHRHSVILHGFVYTSNDQALTGATVKVLDSTTHQKLTNATGEYKFSRLHTGAFTITVSAPGYITQTKNITVSENGTVNNDFIMIATVGTPNNNNPSE